MLMQIIFYIFLKTFFSIIFLESFFCTYRYIAIIAFLAGKGIPSWVWSFGFDYCFTILTIKWHRSSFLIKVLPFFSKFFNIYKISKISHMCIKYFKINSLFLAFFLEDLLLIVFLERESTWVLLLHRSLRHVLQ